MVSRTIPIKWTPSFVFSYFLECILLDHGVPQFMHKVFGTQTPEGTAILVCRDFDERDILPSYYVVGIPKEVWEIIKTKEKRGGVPEWKKILALLVPEDLLDDVARALKDYFEDPSEIELLKRFQEMYKRKNPQIPYLRRDTAEHLLKKIVQTITASTR